MNYRSKLFKVEVKDQPKDVPVFQIHSKAVTAEEARYDHRQPPHLKCQKNDEIYVGKVHADV